MINDSDKLTRIVFTISSLGAGGAERNLVLLCNELVTRGHKVAVLTFEAEGDIPFYELSDDIEVYRLGAEESRGLLESVFSNIKRVQLLRLTISKLNPKVVFAFMEQTAVLSILACFGKSVPVVCCERIDPGQYSPGRIWEFLRRITYPIAAAVTFQTERAASSLGWLGDRRHVIPNPVRVPDKRDCPECPSQPFIACIGRLVPQKGFDLFLPAFAGALEKCPRWKAVIMGEGYERETLETQANLLGISNNVVFTGNVEHVGSYLHKASLFVLSSRFEGFPTALCEALGCGVPAVAFDCPTGPREIICDEVDGILVEPENTHALSQAMIRLMSDPELRNEMGNHAIQVKERFSQSVIVDQWESLIEDVVLQKV